MKHKKLISIAILIIFALQYIFTVAVSANEGEYLNDVMKMVIEQYYQDISTEELINGAMKGILGTMDKYTVYFNKEESKTFIGNIEGSYKGIGVVITQCEEGVLVTQVFRNSPAELSGIIAGDKIISVDGTSIAGYTVEQAAAMIKGKEGSKVELEIKREDRIFKISVVRAKISINPVTWRVEGDIGYIKIESFNMNASKYFEKALLEMDSRGIKKLIIDLRNNPGGEVKQAVSIARHLVPEGLITKLDFKSPETKDISYYSYIKKPEYISCILVNENSASASEILAGAVQDSEQGFLVGTKTFGKGIVQTFFPVLTPEAYDKYKKRVGKGVINAYDLINNYGVYPFENEIMGYIKITTGHYLTRNGRMIHGIGLKPLVEVEDYEKIDGIDVNMINDLEDKSNLLLNSENMNVYSAERILKLAGYDVGKPDLVLDERTVSALKIFQRDNNIKPDGIIGGETRIMLNEKLKELRMKIDKQYAKAVEIMALFK